MDNTTPVIDTKKNAAKFYKVVETYIKRDGMATLRERKHMVNIGSVGYTFDGMGMLMIDGKCVDRKEAISVIGCSSEDFDNLMLGNAKGVEESGKILFPNATLAQIQLFCLQQIVATSKAA